jgi:hypothetical protein
VLTFVLAVHVWFGTYSVLDVGKPGIPQLSTIQTRWLHLIHAVPEYRKRWSYLRFTRQPENNYPSVPPLIVFDALGLDRVIKTDVGGAFPSFHVIGEPCNAMYSPQMRMYHGETSAVCQPYIIKLEPPVPGESSVSKPSG